MPIHLHPIASPSPESSAYFRVNLRAVLLILFKIMLDALITSKTRLKILLKFFLNQNSKSYLRQLEQEFGESSNAIRIELNRFEKAGLLSSQVSGNRKYFQANSQHPLYEDINRMVLKSVGIDSIVANLAQELISIEAVYLIGNLACGISSNLIDLAILAQPSERNKINESVTRIEQSISRKIRYLLVNQQEMKDLFDNKPNLLIWHK